MSSVLKQSFDSHSGDALSTLTLDGMRSRWRVHAGVIAWPTILLMGGILLGEVAVWAGVLSGQLALGWAMLAATILAYMAFTVMHEASHGNIDGGHQGAAFLEDVLGWISGTILSAPYPVFRILHLRHHAHTNDADHDPDHWVVGGSPLSVVLRCFTIVPHYYVDYFLGESGRSEAGRRARGATVLGFALMVVGFGALIAAGLGREALLLWLVPAWVASGLLAFAFDWLPHHPHALQERFRDTRVLLLPGATVTLLSQNYHLIHHLHPRVPFYRYGACFREIRPLLEAEGAPIEGVGANALSRPFATNLTTRKDGRFEVEVVRFTRPTPSTVTLYLRRADGQALTFVAGQYLPITVPVDGEQLRRCYSLCTAAPSAVQRSDALEHAITVKRVPGGRVSNWLNDEACRGLRFTAEPPAGSFTLDVDDAPEHLILIGGGSGMTPLMSMLRTAVRDATETRVTLIAGNRDLENILFRDALAELVAEHPERLQVRQVLDTPPVDWDGGSGPLDGPTLLAQMRDLGVEDSETTRYAICGPAPMMRGARQALVESGVAAPRISEERFAPAAFEAAPDGPAQSVTFRIDGTEREVVVQPGQTVLQAALKADVPAAWSCGGGACGTCMMRLESGDVEHADADALLEGERADGWFLACCARPRSACVVSQR